MPLTISRRCADIKPSLTLATDARAKAMKAEGRRVFGFAAGEPDFPTPAYICGAAREAIARGLTRYTATSGIPELRKAVCDRLARDNGLSYAPDQVIVSNGAKHSLFNALMAVVDPGDEVLLPTPCWLSYPELIRMADGVPVLCPTTEENGFLPDMERLSALVTPRTKALLINSPSNPTGCVYPETLLRQIADFAVEKGLFIIADEIYEKLVYDGQRHISVASLGEAVREQAIVVNGVSKTYAMTGWRIGYAMGPRAVVAAMTAYQSHATSNPNTIAQYASLAALTAGEEEICAMRDAFDARRRLMVERVRGIEGMSCVVPQGAFYVMANVRPLLGRRLNGAAIDSAVTLSALLLDEAQVAAVPGDPFEAPGYLRLSYACGLEDIREGMDAMEAFVKLLEP